MTPAERVVGALTDRGESLAVAESLTGGLVSAALVRVPGSSAVFRAGVVAYTPEMKTELLGVPGTLVDDHGVVSAAVAQAMADGVRRRCGTDWGVGTTGAAGPESHGGQPPGVVWLAISGPGGMAAARRHGFTGDRESVRAAAVDEVLRLLEGRLPSSGVSAAD